MKTARCRGKFKKIWRFNILVLVKNKTVHILSSRLIMFVFDSSIGQNILCEGGLLWICVCVCVRFISVIIVF